MVNTCEGVEEAETSKVQDMLNHMKYQGREWISVDGLGKAKVKNKRIKSTTTT